MDMYTALRVDKFVNLGKYRSVPIGHSQYLM